MKIMNPHGWSLYVAQNFQRKKKIVSIWIQLIPFQKSNWDSMVAIYHLFWHPSSIILSKITLIPFYSIPSLWIGFVGGKFQALPFYWKPETECVNSCSKSSQWIYPDYCLHSTWTQLDHVTHLGQQDISKCDTGKGLKSAGNFDYPLLLAAFRTQLQCEKAQTVKYEVRPGTVLLAKSVIGQDQSVHNWCACLHILVPKLSLTLSFWLDSSPRNLP